MQVISNERSLEDQSLAHRVTLLHTTREIQVMMEAIEKQLPATTPRADSGDVVLAWPHKELLAQAATAGTVAVGATDPARSLPAVGLPPYHARCLLVTYHAPCDRGGRKRVSCANLFPALAH